MRTDSCLLRWPRTVPRTYHQLAVRDRGTEWRGAGGHGGVNYYHVYRVIIYSDKNDLLLDNQGTLVTLDIPLSPDADNGTTFPVYLLDNSVTLSDRQKQNVLTSQENGTITIEEIPRPDLQPSDVTFEPSAVNPEGELTVKWKVANVGKVATEDGWSEQIVLAAVSGGVTKQLTTTYYDGTLAAGTARPRSYCLPCWVSMDCPRFRSLLCLLIRLVNIRPFATTIQPRAAVI